MKTLATRGAGIVVAGLVLLSSGCAHGIGAEPHGTRWMDGDAAVQVNVTNLSGGPMEVYAAGSGTSYRLGTVQPGIDRRFVVRPGVIVNGAVELVARGDNGRVVQSAPVLLAPGAVADFRLETQASISTLTVRPRPAPTVLTDAGRN